MMVELEGVGSRLHRHGGWEGGGGDPKAAP